MAIDAPPFEDRIVQDPAVMAGKPVIRGTRIPVERVIVHLAHVPDLPDLFATYPELTLEDVQAALHYAHAKMIETQPRRKPTASASASGA